jgi:hypothetical protein
MSSKMTMAKISTPRIGLVSNATIRTGRQKISVGKGIPAERVVSELWVAHRQRGWGW